MKCYMHKIEHHWTPTWWNCRVNFFLPIVHWDTIFNGISKAVWFRTSKQIEHTPLKPQFHPFTINSFSSILFLYVWVKNIDNVSTLLLKQTYLDFNHCKIVNKLLSTYWIVESTISVKSTTSEKHTHVPCTSKFLTSSMLEELICSIFPVFEFLNTILWSVSNDLESWHKSTLEYTDRDAGDSFKKGSYLRLPWFLRRPWFRLKRRKTLGNSFHFSKFIGEKQCDENKPRQCVAA